MGFMSGVGGFGAGVVLTPVTMLAAGITASNLVPEKAKPTAKWLIAGITSVASGVLLMVSLGSSPYATGFRSAIVISSALAGCVSGFLTVSDNLSHAFGGRDIADKIMLATLIASVAGSIIGGIGVVAINPIFGCFVGSFSAYAITLGFSQLIVDNRGYSISAW